MTERPIAVSGQDWYYNLGHRYNIQTTFTDYSAAKASCKAMGASLVTIDESHELEFIHRKMVTLGVQGPLLIGKVVLAPKQEWWYRKNTA